MEELFDLNAYVMAREVDSYLSDQWVIWQKREAQGRPCLTPNHDNTRGQDLLENIELCGKLPSD